MRCKSSSEQSIPVDDGMKLCVCSSQIAMEFRSAIRSSIYALCWLFQNAKESARAIPVNAFCLFFPKRHGTCKINSSRCSVFASSQNAMEPAINSSRCFVFVVRKRWWYLQSMPLRSCFIFVSSQYTMNDLQAIPVDLLSVCLFAKRNGTCNHFL